MLAARSLRALGARSTLAARGTQSRLAALNGESCVGEAPDVVMERLRNASRPLELEFWSRGTNVSK